MAKPFLIVVTGPPGSGKTTLAKTLAAEIHCPLLCRDELKKGYVHTHGVTDSAANRTIYEAFFATIALLLDQQISLIAEAAFQHHVWAPRLEALQARARLRLVVCQVDPALAQQRRQKRRQANPDWHRFHGDTDARLYNAKQAYQPPELPFPTLTVATSNGYAPELADIVSFVLDM